MHSERRMRCWWFQTLNHRRLQRRQISEYNRVLLNLWEKMDTFMEYLYVYICVYVFIYIHVRDLHIHYIYIYVYREKGKSIYKKTQKIRNIMQCNIYISVHLNICIYMYTRNFVWAAIKGYGLSSHLRIALFDHLLDAQKKLVCRSTNCSTYISTFTGCFLHPTVPKTLLMMTLYLSNQLVNLSTINQTLPSTIVNPSTLVKVQGRKQRFVHRLGAETSTLRLPHYFAP